MADENFLLRCQDLRDYINKNAETLDYETLTNFARRYDDFESSEVTDSILYINFKNDYTYFFDKYGKSALDTNGLSLLDTTLLDRILDSLATITQDDTLFYESSEFISIQSLSTRSSNSSPVVRKMSKNLVYWHNIVHDYTKSELTRICKRCGVSMKECSSLSELLDIGYFDIAVISSHGATKGLLIPITYEAELAQKDILPKKKGTIWTKNASEDMEAFCLSREELNKLLPDLSNTIVWTEVCYAGSQFSEVRKAFVDKNALEYYGSCIDFEADTFFNAFTRWASSFFKGYWDSQHAFEAGNYDPNFKRISEKIVFYVEGGALTPIKEEGHLWITGWRKLSSRVRSLLAGETRSSGGAIDGSGEGLLLVNVDTNEERYIPFDDQTVQHYKAYDHGDITQFNIAVDPGELDSESTYKYASYFTDENGNKVTEGEYVYFTPKFGLREKLIQFYNDTDGPNWTHNDNWCSDKPLEDWYGINLTITESLDTLIDIQLSNNNLIGDASLTDCKELRSFYVSNNSLFSINLSGCESLISSDFYDNRISDVHIDGTCSLVYLRCGNNSIDTLDLKDSHSLRELYIDNNNSTLSLSLSCSKTLWILNGNNCGINSLDIHGYTSLSGLFLDDNPIEYLDISECSSLGVFYIKDSRYLRYLDASGCHSLTKLNCGWGNDWGGESSHGPLSFLDVTNCTSLTSLTCHGGSLTSLSLKGCYALKELWCNDNLLQSIDISDCKSIYGINCASNQLSSISLSGFSNLNTLYICFNNIQNLSLSNCISLKHLECYYNDLITLDLSGCFSLIDISCEHNRLSSLNLSDSSNIEHVFVDNNKMASLHLQNKSHLKYLWCSYNDLIDIDVSNCPLLENFKFTGNRKMESLFINSCASLQSLSCSNLNLKYLGIENCSSLVSLSCDNNRLTSLNTTGCVSLKELSCKNNLIIQEVPYSFTQLTYFNHDPKFTYTTDSEGNITYHENEVGWYYPGEPGKGYHGW